MGTLSEHAESAIPLTSTVEDENDVDTADRISASDTLLGNDLNHGNHVRKLSVLNWIPFLTNRRQRRWKHGNGMDFDGIRTKPPIRRSQAVLRVGLGILVLLGIVQVVGLLGFFMMALLPDRLHQILRDWGRPGQIGAGLASWPTDFSRDILPIPCHSHNDYWRKVPVYSAIEAGCISIEADIWLFDEELFVGHSIRSLTANRTLNSLYIHPLLDIISGQNPESDLVPDPDASLHGVFDTTPEQSLVLLIDFKTPGSTTWPFLMSALEPFRSRGYLTYLNGTELVPGPITVVGTGNAPFDLIASGTDNPHRDVFYDAPLDQMYESPGGEVLPFSKLRPRSIKREEGRDLPPADKTDAAEDTGQDTTGTTADPNSFTKENSYYASTSFQDSIGHVRGGKLSAHQLELLRGQVRGAHRRGLKARYWELPFWPISLRDQVWNIIVNEGVDVLNVDDLRGATKRNWDDGREW